MAAGKGQLNRLTDQQKRFCDNILSGMKQVDAYADSYPKASRKSAIENASKLRKAPHVNQYLEEQGKMAAERVGISREWLLSNLRQGVESENEKLMVPSAALIARILQWDKPDQLEVKTEVTFSQILASLPDTSDIRGCTLAGTN